MHCENLEVQIWVNDWQYSPFSVFESEKEKKTDTNY